MPQVQERVLPGLRYVRARLAAQLPGVLLNGPGLVMFVYMVLVSAVALRWLCLLCLPLRTNSFAVIYQS